jgi:uncharacterized protein (DUF488 family)
MRTVFTVGYQGSSQTRFVEGLGEAGVSLLVDVRDRTASRKPGFSKAALEQALAAAGIVYEHWRELGTPKPIRDLLRQKGDWESYRRAYLERLDEREELLGTLARRIQGESACLMCYERDALACHRSLIGQRMKELGLIDGVGHLEPGLRQ